MAESESGQEKTEMPTPKTVSYTHLTLPTS